MQHSIEPTEFVPSMRVSRRALLQGLAVTGLVAGAHRMGRAAPSRPMRYLVAPWSDALAVTHVASALLEQHYQYKVDVVQTDIAIVYASLGEGKGDVMSMAWFDGKGALKGEFKGGHASYMPKIADKVQVLGIALGPQQVGFVVPDYVEARTPEDLNRQAEKLGGNIIGIDPGSGLVQAAERAIKEYGIKLKLVTGSEAAMVAALKRAIARKEWIVVTAYSPHPLWNLTKMRYIEDPKKVFGEEAHFFTLAQKNFEKEFPEAQKFFTKYHLPNDAASLIMEWIDGGMQGREAAMKWISESKGKGVIEPWLS
jgi:glycine betaine/proline transport system substrate-binding protein